jgi:glycosyltransferase involved in cell wall biosynthesis
MTANIVVEGSGRQIPILWILHEWWDDEMIKENLRIRNYEGLTLHTVKKALSLATRVVCVCESQKKLYNPSAPTAVIFVGVPDPVKRLSSLPADPTEAVEQFTPSIFQLNEMKKKMNQFTILCLGIVCPRKNQIWTVQLFKKFAENLVLRRKIEKKKSSFNIRLQIVGARNIRTYEIEYLERLKEEIGHDNRIELHDVTEDVDQFYRSADCLMLTSLNEVTPMVISEALSWGIPVLSTDIAGIKEMYVDGIEGFLFSPTDEKKALQSLELLYHNPVLRQQMGQNARKRYEAMFDLKLMVDQYRHLVFTVAPPVILIQLEGCLMDCEKGFRKKWKNRPILNREKSWNIESCVPTAYSSVAKDISRQKGFFEELDWINGAEEALHGMKSVGFQIFLSLTHQMTEPLSCLQEKMNWVKNHLGEEWVERVILASDKVESFLFLCSMIGSHGSNRQ